MVGGRKGRPNRVQISKTGRTGVNDNVDDSPDLTRVARSLNMELEKEMDGLNVEQISSAMKMLASALQPLDKSNQLKVRESLNGMFQKSGSPMHAATSPQSWADESEDMEDGNAENTEGISGKSMSPWDSFDVSKLSSAGFKLQFIEPNECSGQKFGKIDHQDVQSEIAYWNNAVIVYVLGANPPYAIMNGFLRRIWGKYGVDKIVMAKNGMLLAHFESSTGRDDVIEAGVFHFDNKPLIVRPWSEDYEVNGANIAKVPIWIKLPQLDIKYWSPICISKICSVIGHPIMVDRNTEEKFGINFVRALVEVDIGGQFPTEVLYQNLQGRMMSQEVVYEWKPTKCTFCEGIGHEEDKCRKKLPRKVWVPKEVSKTSKEGEKGVEQPRIAQDKSSSDGWKPVQRRNNNMGQKSKVMKQNTVAGNSSNAFAVLENNSDELIGNVNESVIELSPPHEDNQKNEELHLPSRADIENMQIPGDPSSQGNG